MPVAYQRLEMAPGQTMAYHMASRRNTFAVSEISKGSTCPTFRFQDSLSRGFISGAESPQSSSHKMPSPQDSVVQGLSALSLRGQLPTETGSIPEENQTISFEKLNTCLYQGSISRVRFSLEPSSACMEPFVSLPLGCKLGKEACSKENSSGTFRSDIEASSHGSTLSTASAQPPTLSRDNSVPRSSCLKDGSGDGNGFYSYSNNLWSFSSLSTGATKDELQEDVLSPVHDDMEADTSLGSSPSSEIDVPLESSSSCGEALQLSDDTEAQSAYKGSADPYSSIIASSPPRKGLSRFYAGKSQSFSCVRDVVSMKDLAKPEHGCAKKRKMGSSADRSRFPPLQKGPASGFKKPPNGAKSTLALAVVMSATEEQESQGPLRGLGDLRSQSGVVPSRSYSLSDLHGAARSIFFLG